MEMEWYKLARHALQRALPCRRNFGEAHAAPAPTRRQSPPSGELNGLTEIAGLDIDELDME